MNDVESDLLPEETLIAWALRVHPPRRLGLVALALLRLRLRRER